MDITVKALQSFVHGRLAMCKGAEQPVAEAIAKDLVKAGLVVAASPDVTAPSGSRKKTGQGSNKESASNKPSAGGDKDGAEGGTEGSDKGGIESEDQSKEQ